MGNLMNRFKGAQSVSELLDMPNLKRASDMGEMTDQPPTRDVKAKRPSGKPEKAIDTPSVVADGNLHPKKALSKKRIPFPNRVNEDVVSAFKAQPDTAHHVEQALLEYSIKKGWL